MKQTDMGMLNGMRAVIFDVDGTLYQQRALRRRMTARLAATYWSRPDKGIHVIKALQAYRRAHEELRNQTYSSDLQLALAAKKAGYTVSDMRGVVEEWFARKPLDLLARCVYPELLQFLRLLSERRISCGVFSDYPAEAKLSAMGLRDFFAHVLCAAEVGSLKPNPAGLLLLAKRTGLAPADMLYIGDRTIDLEAAAAAGMRGLLIQDKTTYATLVDQLRSTGA